MREIENDDEKHYAWDAEGLYLSQWPTLCQKMQSKVAYGVRWSQISFARIQFKSMEIEFVLPWLLDRNHNFLSFENENK